MNVFEPPTIDTPFLGLDGHYTLSGEYQGRKFIVDDINPIELQVGKNVMLSDIALRSVFKGEK